MRGLRFTLVALAAISGCGSDSHSSAITCGTSSSASGALTTGGNVTVTSGDDLNGAAIAADSDATPPSGSVTIGCAADIVPDGFVALGPAVSFGTDGTWSDRPFDFTLPYKAARVPANASRGAVRIVAMRAGGQPYFPPVSNRELDDKDSYASRAAFRSGELMTYQVVASMTAGTTHQEQFGFNALIGVSMGGNATMALAMRHPDRFDIAADLGGEPGPSMVYTLGMVKTFLFGGFCTAADQLAGRGDVGTLCPAHSTKKLDQLEADSDYEHFLYQAGDGVGLTLDRSLYMEGVRDMARAMSNPALYNPANAYAPAGVDFSYMATDRATRCANPIVLHDFYDKDFNPTGSNPVITYCDGGDSAAPGGLGLGVFDPTLPQTDPSELLLAVDLNNNGKRDQGEPVLMHPYEPFDDVGTDGLADQDEPGYDQVTNPDPNHDDYHYLRNPTGTEGNGNYDPGEPFQDFGLDGVAGTCQVGSTPPSGTSACYDYGEGNGVWDLNPNVKGWYADDYNLQLAALTPDQRQHMSTWFDGGIRDFLNASVSSNQAVGQAMAQYQLPFGVYDGFHGVVPTDTDDAYDFGDILWTDLPKHGYLRYGNPDATPAQIMGGDGRHVGTATQIVYRIETGFGFIDSHWPDGDRTDADDAGDMYPSLMFTSPTTGRVNPFALSLPPGYDNPANANARYPVVYVLHGYGQQPSDLVALSSIVAARMVSTEPIATRVQKFIIVYVDGRCRPGSSGVPVTPGGDGCEEGTFYMDAPLGGTARMEQNLLDLMDYIDANYRTKSAAMATVTDE
jgi:hypothetical protein